MGKVNVEDIPDGKSPEDYPEDTVFIWDQKDPAEEEDFWKGLESDN